MGRFGEKVFGVFWRRCVRLYDLVFEDLDLMFEKENYYRMFINEYITNWSKTPANLTNIITSLADISSF